MKKILYILLIGLCSACDSWLDVEPENAVTYANYFKDETELEAIVTEINAYMVSWYSNGSPDQVILALLMDEWNDAQQYTREWNPIRYARGSSWAGYYNVIFLANVLLENSSKAAANVRQERMDFWNGQAYFAKGFSYFLLAQKFGEAIITKNSTSLEPYPKSSVLEVIDEAIRNTKEALRLLPNYEDMKNASGGAITSKQYGNKGSAAALLSHLYAWRGSVIDLYGLEGNSQECYAEAVHYADTLINRQVGNYSLQPSPEELCKAHSHIETYNAESIFEIELDPYSHDYPLSGVPGRLFVTWPIDKYATPADLTQRPFRIYQSTVDALYEDGDKRKSAYFIDSVVYETKQVEVNGETVTQKEIVFDPSTSKFACVIKWREGLYIPTSLSPAGEDMYGIRANYVMFRLADIYLLRAECHNKLGNTEQAKADLNVIRARAGVTLFNGAPEDLQLAIFREREKELFAEGYRFYDIVRNGMDYIHRYLGETFELLSDEQILKGALYLGVSSAAFYMNDLMRQNEYWRQFGNN